LVHKNQKVNNIQPTATTTINMGWFQKKALNDVDLSMCNPIIVNQTNQSIVLFLDRGVLYNKQVLAPGEAVGMTRRETAGTVVPYKIHAVVGDEQALPNRTQSMKNLISTAAIPTAFIVGTMMAASSAGTLTGPSRALSRVAGGMVVRGMVIDSAALAAGSLTASRAAAIADRLIEKHPENYSAKTGHLLPGQRFCVVEGGIETPLTITNITEKQFRQIPIQGAVKVPMDTLREKVEFYTPSIFRFSKKEDESCKAIEGGEEGASTAIEAAPLQASAPPADQQESEEDRQFRLAIEESLKIEEERKREEEAYLKKLKDDKRTSVVLF
jgi:hypothetical protein